MMALDAIWLFGLARNFYLKELGVLAREGGATIGNTLAGLSVYVLMAIGILVFVLPKLDEATLGTTFLYGALLGLVIYGVYDGTNYFILSNYSIKMAVVDVVWGTLALGTSTVIAKAVLDKLS